MNDERTITMMIVPIFGKEKNNFTVFKDVTVQSSVETYNDKQLNILYKYWLKLSKKTFFV